MYTFLNQHNIDLFQEKKVQLSEGQRLVCGKCLKGTLVQDFIVRFSHFCRIINNRQGQGPQFQKIFK
jgi:hypothetical protein